jgi:hypothetical protein
MGAIYEVSNLGIGRNTMKALQKMPKDLQA